MLCLFFIVLRGQEIVAYTLIENFDISNIATSDRYVAIEYKKNINNRYIHYISLYDIENGTLNDILNYNNEIINNDMYFPSISKDGRYVVFTSRADNIISENIAKCYDMSDGVIKNCSNIYIYDTYLMTFSIVKEGKVMLNGDSFIAKISGNGKSVVFETTASNLLNISDYDCHHLNGVKNCINIYKYDLYSESLSLVSTNDDNKGSNRNSVSPSIDYEGRRITYQSNATNILNLPAKYNRCIDSYTNLMIPCINIYLFDTIDNETKVVSQGTDYILDNHCGNSLISQNGKFVAYETYSTNLHSFANYKKHIIIYNITTKENTLVTISNNVLNNRDSHLEDISYDGKYILYRTDSTNLDGGQNLMKMYVKNVINSKTSLVLENEEDILFASVNNLDIYFYDDNFDLIKQKIDTIPPCISEKQIIYILIGEQYNINHKIDVIDNLTSKENLKIHCDTSMISHEGTYTTELVVTDEFGNESYEKIIINVIEKDLEPPIFNGEKVIRVLKGSNELNLLGYISAVDKIDGNVKIYIVDDGGLSLDHIGNYTLKVKAIDIANNVSYTEISVIVYDNYNFTYIYEILVVIIVLGAVIFLLIKVK